MSNIEVQKKVYERWKGYAFDPMREEINIRDQKVRDLITVEGSQKDILDVGCADGIILEPFIKDNNIVGMEISESLSRKARKKGMKVLQIDIEKGFPFPDKNFDIVVATQIMEHIVNTDFFLAECNRVLRKNGAIIVSVPNINTLFSPLIMFLFDYPPPSASRYGSPHVKDFTLSTLTIALENNGFAIEKKQGKLFFIPFVTRFRGLRSMLGDLIPRFADELIMKGRKITHAPYDENVMLERMESRSVVKRLIPLIRWFIK